MGTHCYIGVQDDDGTITYSYCHYDGYPDGVGKVLVNLDHDAALGIAEFGDMRCLNMTGDDPAPDPIGIPESCHVADDVNEYEEAIEEGPVSYGYLLGYHGEWQVWSRHGDCAGAWVDLRDELGLPPKAQARVQPASEPGYTGSTGGTHPMQTNEIIGFCIRNHETGELIANDPSTGRNFCTFEEVAPIARGDAFRRLAGFLDQNPEADPYDFGIETVYRQTTPIENAASELGGIFESLCQRHGLDLGLSRQQINALLVKDLEAVKSLQGFGDLLGIPVPRR